jgi:hypothetical protein
MKWFLTLIALSLLVAVGTWFGGWLLVVVIAAVWGAARASRRDTVWTAALAGIVGWGILLAIDASSGAFGRLLGVIGGLFRLPGGAFVVLTLAYAALLAASAAAVARGVRLLAAKA